MVFSLSSASTLLGDDPQQLETARNDYKRISHPAEEDRAHYILRLAGMRDRLVSAGDWQAVDREIRRHPAPQDADGALLSKLLLGKWSSPRHDYLFRPDGTWTMLPADPNTTHGKWRIEGNQYYETAETDLPETTQYTIILLDPRHFIFTEGQTVFYQTRK